MCSSADKTLSHCCQVALRALPAETEPPCSERLWQKAGIVTPSPFLLEINISAAQELVRGKQQKNKLFAAAVTISGHLLPSWDWEATSSLPEPHPHPLEQEELVLAPPSFELNSPLCLISSIHSMHSLLHYQSSTQHIPSSDSCWRLGWKQCGAGNSCS